MNVNEKRILSPKGYEVKEVSESERSVVAKISTTSRDRDGDVIEPSGLELERYMQNPVVLFSHNYALPIAKTEWVRLEGDSLIAKAVFHDLTEIAKEVWALVKGGILKAWSIGFIPKEWDRLKDEQGKDMEGYHVKRAELVEYSAVTVPSNPDALTLEAAKSLGITSSALMRSFGLETPSIHRKANTLREFEDSLGELGYSKSERTVLAKYGYPGLARREADAELASVVKVAIETRKEIERIANNG